MKYIEDITKFIFISNEIEEADIIFIPGGLYAETSETAAKLWKEGYAPIIMPSGKFSIKLGNFSGPLSKANIYNKNYSSEWEFLKDVLIQNGVAEKVILKEDESTHTYENAIFSRKATDRLNLNIKKAIICCKSFHARRCLMYYETLYPDTEFIVCPTETEGINSGNWFTTDNGIDNVMSEVERCGWQFKDIIKSFIKESSED